MHIPSRVLLTILTQAEFAETTTQVAHFEEKHAELGDMEDLEKQRQGLKAEMTENRTKISEYKVRSPYPCLAEHRTNVLRDSKLSQR